MYTRIHIKGTQITYGIYSKEQEESIIKTFGIENIEYLPVEA